VEARGLEKRSAMLEEMVEANGGKRLIGWMVINLKNEANRWEISVP